MHELGLRRCALTDRYASSDTANSRPSCHQEGGSFGFGGGGLEHEPKDVEQTCLLLLESMREHGDCHVLQN